MTHLHIPDGILPVWLWVTGFLLMALAVGISLYRLRTMDKVKNIPLLGAVSAVMLVVMSLEILPLAYHINLSVVAGILLGPALGFLASFITNLMLAFMGHGGITVMGLNTLLLGSEAILGHALFFVLRKQVPVFWSAALTTVLTLFITTMVLIGVVVVSHIDPDLIQHGHAPDMGHEAPVYASPFVMIVLSLGSIGWIIEAAITGAVVRFISQVKPDLLGHVLHKDSGR